MGVFGAFFGCSGVAGFNGRLLGASSGAGGFMLACISGCRGVIGFKVGTWPCPVREKVRPAWPGEGASAKKFAQRTKNGSKSAFSGVLGEFFRGNAAGGGVLGEFFAEMPMVGVCWGVTAGRDPVGSRPVSQARITSGPPHTRTRRARVEREPRSLLRRIRGSGVAHALGNRVGDRRGDNLGTHESRE